VELILKGGNMSGLEILAVVAVIYFVAIK